MGHGGAVVLVHAYISLFPAQTTENTFEFSMTKKRHLMSALGDGPVIVKSAAKLKMSRTARDCNHEAIYGVGRYRTCKLSGRQGLINLGSLLITIPDDDSRFGETEDS